MWEGQGMNDKAGGGGQQLEAKEQEKQRAGALSP